MKYGPFSATMTIGEALGPAMKITEAADAREYFEALVEHAVRTDPESESRESAEANLRQSLGYYAGYYDEETRARVERLFACQHPVFGAIATSGPLTAEAALRRGLELPGGT